MTPEPIIGGPGFPQPDRVLPQAGGGKRIDFSRGVDLSAIRNKKLHQHRWILVGNYLVEEKGMATLAETVKSVEAAVANGEEPDMSGINIPYGPETMIVMEGPGCAKCGMHWTNPEKGWGKLCDVSDADYQQETVTPPPGALQVPKNPDGIDIRIPVMEEELTKLGMLTQAADRVIQPFLEWLDEEDPTAPLPDAVPEAAKAFRDMRVHFAMEYQRKLDEYRAETGEEPFVDEPDTSSEPDDAA